MNEKPSKLTNQITSNQKEPTSQHKVRDELPPSATEHSATNHCHTKLKPTKNIEEKTSSSCHTDDGHGKTESRSPLSQIFICKTHSATHSATILETPGTCSICKKSLALHKGNYYHCPMCSGIFSLQPESCRKCGMQLNLVRRTFEKDDAMLAVHKRNMRQFILSACLSLVVMAFSMLPFIFEIFSSLMPQLTFNLLMLLLPFACTSIVVLFCGAEILKKGGASLFNGLNMYSLVSLGVSLAYWFSTLVLIGKIFAMPLLAESFSTLPILKWFYLDGLNIIEMLNATPLYFESAASIVTLMLLGEIIESKARNKAGDAIGALLAYAPKKAHRITGSKQDEIAIDDVEVGNLLRVLPGEKIPADGKVTEGESEVIEAMLTGEAFPVNKTIGSVVQAGTKNTLGSLVMLVTACGNETSLARITSRVEKAMKSRPPIAKTVDRISAYFVPIVVCVAVFAFLVWLFAATGSLETRIFLATVAAVSTLIIACPCALGLATPLSISMATKKGAEYGLFFQDAVSLERISKVKTLYSDKTGTLTMGKPQILSAQYVKVQNSTEAKITDEDTTKELYSLLVKATALEDASEHPLAHAFKSAINQTPAPLEAAGIIDKTKTSKNQLIEIKNFAAEVGKGIRGNIAGKNHLLGNEKMMRANKIDIKQNQTNPNANFSLKEILDHAISQPLEKKIETIAKKKLHDMPKTAINQATSRVYHAIDGELHAIYFLEDVLRPESNAAVRSLNRSGVKVIMLSGDSEAACAAVAKKLGIDYFAELSPQQKADIISENSKTTKGLSAMLGDGINDAPALVSANIGISVSEGSNIAMESSHLVVTKGSLLRAEQAIKLSKLTRRNIFTNLTFAFGYNALGVPLAAGALYPIFGIMLQPMVAAAAMAASSLCVTLNALQLGRRKL